ncbi:hypothetical protein [Bailinhaonella thermotolerans]|uniref:Glycosyltransferase RgtA/B/C/D-like domain-containing protein n=1 Tax=Bailinhaonella thermotolerans TaxID=1070861 RepID=A0A3A4BMJ2_9ACTN|nr:hypothetical protein [Bailinhaonella thermotolerans]RJL32232.1 hypothetical protein D5H75_17735 [Bailinhaonella thermotolerans]
MHPSGSPSSPSYRGPHLALVAVALAYCATVVLTTSQSVVLSWDEVIYASQVARDVPATEFSAPRARGMSLVVLPIAAITSSTEAIRIYLTLVSGLALYLAFRPWIRLVGWAAPVAAGLFATLWTTLLYGSRVMPNLWVALTFTGALGCLLLAMRYGSRRPLYGVVAGLALASLVRPTDALILAGPVGLYVLVKRYWPGVIAMSAGLAVGWGSWAVEAFARFGDPVRRFKSGAGTQDSIGFYLYQHLEGVDGPYMVCMPTTLCAGFRWSAVLWWLLLPVLAAVGVAVARRGHRSDHLLAIAAALTLAASYILVFSFGNSRFLTPSYALLAIPAAAAFVHTVRRRAVWARAAAAVAATALVGAHFVVQLQTMDRVMATRESSDDAAATRARYMADRLGVKPPCLVWGDVAVTFAYPMKCQAMVPWGPDATDEATARRARATTPHTVVLTEGRTPPPPDAANWEKHRLPGKRDLYAWVSPSR